MSTFRAVVIEKNHTGQTVALTDFSEADRMEGDVELRVTHTTVNYKDGLAITGKAPVVRRFPMIPGVDCAGVVETSSHPDFQPGDRVILNGWGTGETHLGAFAEKSRVKGDRLVPLPADLTPSEAMAIGTAGYTAMLSILALEKHGLQPADGPVIVTGAAGGVGLAAIELGKAFGAKVVAAVSSKEKAAAAKSAGADDTLIYARAPFDKAQSKTLAEQFKAAVGRDGAHVIYDPVGGDYAEPALRSIAWEGKYLVVGFPAGIPKLPLNLTLLKSCDVCGVFWGAFAARDPKANQAHIETLFELWAEGKIAPRVTEVFAFEDGGKAIAKMAARGAIGKLVVEVG